MTKELQLITKLVACRHDLDPADLASFIQVESGGKGFDDNTGKILIQFEPVWFRRLTNYAPSGLWSVNKVDVQLREWLAFNDAFKKNPDKAMQSTSIGLGQIMGFHYKDLGFKSVGDMWDFSKASLENQVELIARFIKHDRNLLEALKTHDWFRVASIYNGKDFVHMAQVWKRERYDFTLAREHKKFEILFK